MIEFAHVGWRRLVPPEARQGETVIQSKIVCIHAAVGSSECERLEPTRAPYPRHKRKNRVWHWGKEDRKKTDQKHQPKCFPIAHFFDLHVDVRRPGSFPRLARNRLTRCPQEPPRVGLALPVVRIGARSVSVVGFPSQSHHQG